VLEVSDELWGYFNFNLLLCCLRVGLFLVILCNKILFQGQAFVKHLIDRSEELLVRSSLSASIQVTKLGNESRATNVKVDLLSTRVERLEKVVDLSFAEFAEEQDGRMNQE